jgi:hypothetical protein
MHECPHLEDEHFNFRLNITSIIPNTLNVFSLIHGKIRADTHIGGYFKIHKVTYQTYMLALAAACRLWTNLVA